MCVCVCVRACVVKIIYLDDKNKLISPVSVFSYLIHIRIHQKVLMMPYR